MTHVSYVGVAGDTGEPLGEDPAPPLVRLRLEDDVHPGSLEPEVEPADPAEERSDIHSPSHRPASPGVTGWWWVPGRNTVTRAHVLLSLMLRGPRR
jgi:hypothetical protein